MVTIEQIERGVASYLDEELMPNLPQNGIQKVMAGTAISLVIRKSGNIVKELTNQPFVKMLGIMDEEGSVDIDVLKDELKHNITDEGIVVDFPLIGTMTFHRSDVDSLYKHITGGNE